AYGQDQVVIGQEVHLPMWPGTRAGQDHGAHERMGRPPRHQLGNDLLLRRNVHHRVLSLAQATKETAGLSLAIALTERTRSGEAAMSRTKEDTASMRRPIVWNKWS